MTVSVRNDQRSAPVDAAKMARLTRRALRQLAITGRGEMAITFLDDRRMRTLNKRFMRHDRTTDVLTFRYDGEPTVGEIFISPAQARIYARAHGLTYDEELSRYVMHGLLHWLGHDDRTKTEQAAMRTREERLMKACGMLNGAH